MSSLFLKITEQKGGQFGNEPLKSLTMRGFYKLYGKEILTQTSTRLSQWMKQIPENKMAEIQPELHLDGGQPLSVSAGCFLSQEHIQLCFWVVACVAYAGRKEVGHRCGLRFLLCTRVTCQLMWPSWDVNRSGKNQMFSFTSGASTLFFSRRWQANMSRYWPGTLGLWERSRTRSLGSQNIKI